MNVINEECMGQVREGKGEEALKGEEDGDLLDQGQHGVGDLCEESRETQRCSLTSFQKNENNTTSMPV